MKFDGNDLIVFFGISLLVTGIELIYLPAALITAGLCLAAAGILRARAQARKGGR